MTKKSEQPPLIHSNIRVFFEIAKESLRSMNSLIQNGQKPKPNGDSGSIIIYDPDHKSFKEGLVAIVFCGIYLESLLHHLIVKKHGIEKYKECDRGIYEAKLKLLDCTDELIHCECKYYRTVRKEIVHEKAHIDVKDIKWAQKEAARAFNMIESINAHFGIKMG